MIVAIALSRRSFFFHSKNNDLSDLKNIAKFKKTKTKKRFLKSQNKKSFMTKTQKKTIKFTKRNFFKFEHVKQKFEIRAKRIKKNVIVKKKLSSKKNNQSNYEKSQKTRRK